MFISTVEFLFLLLYYFINEKTANNDQKLLQLPASPSFVSGVQIYYK